MDGEILSIPTLRIPAMFPLALFILLCCIFHGLTEVLQTEFWIKAYVSRIFNGSIAKNVSRPYACSMASTSIYCQYAVAVGAERCGDDINLDMTCTGTSSIDSSPWSIQYVRLARTISLPNSYGSL